MENDMRDKLTDIIGSHTDLTRSQDSCVADDIIAALPTMVVPLVWEGVADDCFVSCDMGTHSYEITVVDTLERRGDYSWGVAYVQSGYRDKDVPTPYQATFDQAKAAAQAHHVTQIMAAFGVNT